MYRYQTRHCFSISLPHHRSLPQTTSCLPHLYKSTSNDEKTRATPKKLSPFLLLLSTHLLPLHGVEDGTGELLSGSGAAHVASPGALGDDVVDGLGDAVGVVVEAEVAEHHAAGEDEGGGVGLVLALDVEADVAAAGLEDGDLAAHVAAGDDAGAADEAGADVGQDAAVQVGHDHDVELLGAADALHGGVVDDHVVGLDGGVLLADLLDGVAEEAVGQLHDVGLVDAGDLAAVVGQGEGEGELGDALGLGAGDYLEGLDDAGDGLVLEAGVLALGVLADDAQVDVLVAGVVAGDVLDEDDGGVDVELLAEGDVEGLVAGALDGRVEDTLEAELVALQGSDGLAEELLGVLAALLHAGDVDLLPLNGHIVGLEDGLDGLGDLGTDTVTWGDCPLVSCFLMYGIFLLFRGAAHTWDEGDGVLAAKLGGLEDVGTGGGVAWKSRGLIGMFLGEARRVSRRYNISLRKIERTPRGDRRACNGGAQKSLRDGVLARRARKKLEDEIAIPKRRA